MRGDNRTSTRENDKSNEYQKLRLGYQRYDYFFEKQRGFALSNASGSIFSNITIMSKHLLYSTSSHNTTLTLHMYILPLLFHINIIYTKHWLLSAWSRASSHLLIFLVSTHCYPINDMFFERLSLSPRIIIIGTILLWACFALLHLKWLAHNTTFQAFHI